MNAYVLIKNQVELHELLGKKICREMLLAIKKIGFSEADIVSAPDFEKAEFSLKTDPYTADENLFGLWRDEHKQRIGTIQFNSDGSFYAEYDVVKLHPAKKQWFVEGVSAWGKGNHVKTEAKLLPTM